MVRLMKMSRYAHLVDQFEQTLENPTTLFFWHIMQLLFVLAMVAHLCGCFWFLVGTQSGPAYPDPDGNPVSWNVPGVNIPEYVVDPWYKWLKTEVPAPPWSGSLSRRRGWKGN